MTLFSEKAFDQMSLFVEMGIVLSLHFPIGTGRNHRDLTLSLGQFQYTVGIVTFICQQIDAYEPSEQGGRRNHIMNIAAGQKQPQGVAQGITTAWTLVVKPPLDLPIA
jgi:hypothetical protein